MLISRGDHESGLDRAMPKKMPIDQPGLKICVRSPLFQAKRAGFSGQNQVR